MHPEPTEELDEGRRSLECPYCGETVDVFFDAVGVSSEQYVEDCPVCCRPWNVTVTREDAQVLVLLGRDDE
ncbi:MAG: CPXCG motif-containing cysteine-rich protein [Myxococcaceae bacterium]